eukprot:349687-Chlamydomonas_euryale.AAC.1
MRASGTASTTTRETAPAASHSSSPEPPPPPVPAALPSTRQGRGHSPAAAGALTQRADSAPRHSTENSPTACRRGSAPPRRRHLARIQTAPCVQRRSPSRPRRRYRRTSRAPTAAGGRHRRAGARP